jgi:peptide/nickel transport system ATP-binding protein
MPVVWSDRCLLHEPAAEIWVGTPTPAAETPARATAILDELDAHVIDAQAHGDAAVHDEAPDAVRIPTGCRFHPRCPDALPECRDVDPDLRSAGADHCAACILVS